MESVWRNPIRSFGSISSASVPCGDDIRADGGIGLDGEGIALADADAIRVG